MWLLDDKSTAVHWLAIATALPLSICVSKVKSELPHLHITGKKRAGHGKRPKTRYHQIHSVVVGLKLVKLRKFCSSLSLFNPLSLSLSLSFRLSLSLQYMYIYLINTFQIRSVLLDAIWTLDVLIWWYSHVPSTHGASSCSGLTHCSWTLSVFGVRELQWSCREVVVCVVWPGGLGLGLGLAVDC